MLSGVITIALVIRLLSPVLQGYYYAFFSLLVLQQFLQAGLSSVVQQFASHEWAHLSIAGGVVVGDSSAVSRLTSLVQQARLGFRVTSGLVLVILVVAGHLLYGAADAQGVDWARPWYCLCLATALSMLTQPMSAILNGTGYVSQDQRAQFAGGVVGSVGGWIALLTGLGLYSVSVIVGLRSAMVFLMLVPPHRPFGRLRFAQSQNPGVTWGELWPLQWRITASWLTGLLMYQSMVPLAFLLLGPVAAGQIGVQSQIFLAVVGIGGSWLVSAQPRFGRLAAMRQFEEIRLLTRATSLRSSITTAFVGLAAVILVAAIDMTRPEVGARFGPVPLLFALIIAATMMAAQSAAVAAIRFQKKEPFVLQGAISSACSIAAMAIGATTNGLAGVVIGFSAVIIGLITPWSVAIYKREMAREEATGSALPPGASRLASGGDPPASTPTTGDTP